MPSNRFKYCAFHYLNQWLSQDREVCETLDDSEAKEKEKLDMPCKGGCVLQNCKEFP